MRRVFCLISAVLVVSALFCGVFALSVSAEESETGIELPASAEDEWQPDDSSIFNSLRSTVSHYLFNDDFSNVPFGSGWVDLICTMMTCFIFLLPFFGALIAFRWICRL